MKRFLTAAGLLLVGAAPAQTLFTYGKDSVSATEFLAAYKKNNEGKTDEAALRSYLDLYIASRLKVKAARDAAMDTLPQLKADLAALRQQLLPAYLNDKESVDRLVAEAFERSQKDIRAAHIFIAFQKNGRYDAEGAAARRDAALAALTKGTPFETVARQHSDDPAALTTDGNLGWVTVFGLPYELETLLYTTPVGKTSAAYASKAGYHIVRNLAERKALGRMRAAQILLAFPPGADEAFKARRKQTADSLHTRLLTGEDFGKLAAAFSNDVLSASANGEMQPFGVGEYGVTFEEPVFVLAEDGAITKPFLTEHGYHIVKRLGRQVPATTATPEALTALRTQVEGNDRLQVARRALAKAVLQKAGYQALLSPADLWRYSDSLLTTGRPPQGAVQSGTAVMRLGGSTATAADWAAFAQGARYTGAGTAKPYPQLWDEFVEAQALQQYQKRLEEYNEAFRRQLQEFADGNLFFEIMQQKVWTPAQNDSAALLAHYQQHRDRYRWNQSADAVVFYAANEAAAKRMHKVLQADPGKWRRVLADFSEEITSDSGRFELDQLPTAYRGALKAGRLTAPVLNTADNTASFAYVQKLHTGPAQKTFAEARGQVVTDYQTAVEQAWVEELRQRYPVKVNEAVWREVVKNPLSP